MSTRRTTREGEREQRRSVRHPASLGVQLAYGAERQVVRTVDVSLHGLFVATDRPPRERFMVQLTIYLPDGPLPATAFVSRSVRRGGAAQPGVGLQLFALDAGAKGRWDRFVRSLGGSATPLPTISAGRFGNEGRSTFLLKLRDQARIEELYARNLVSGELYLATPVIKDPGSEVALIVIHPRTEHELVLIGRVVQVHRERPKGMAIRIHPPLGPGDLLVIQTFIETGAAPSAPLEQVIASERPVREPSVEIVIEEPVPYHPSDPEFEWGDISEDLIVDLDLDDVDPFAGRTPTPAAFAEGAWSEVTSHEALVDVASPTVETISPEVPIEAPIEDGPAIPIEEAIESVREPTATEPSAASAAADFEAPETVSVDLETPDLSPAAVREALAAASTSDDEASARSAPAPDPAASPEPTTADLQPPDVDSPTRDLVIEDLGEVRATNEVSPEPALHEPELHVRLSCSSCDAPPTTLVLGGVSGALGLVARAKPYVCEACDAYVSIVRLKPMAERRRAREALWIESPAALDAKVDVALLFDVAAMASSTARCPICGAAGRSSDATAAIEDASLGLAPGIPVEIENAPCRACGEPVRLELVSP